MMVSGTNLIMKFDPSVTNATKLCINCFKKIVEIGEVMTVEPLVACYVIPMALCSTVYKTLETEKACAVDNMYNETVCDAIVNGLEHGYVEETHVIQKTVTDMYTWQFPVQQIIPVVLILFMGSYSDKHKIRKPFLILPFVGYFISLVATLISLCFVSMWPVAVQGLFQNLIPAWFGGQIMLVMGASAYVSDVSDAKARTFRFAVIQVVKMSCSIVLTAVGGILSHILGYYYVLGIALVININGMLYGIFYVKEVKFLKKDNENVNKSCNKAKNEKNVKYLEWSYATDTIKLLLKKNEGVQYSLLVLSILLMFFFVTVLAGN